MIGRDRVIRSRRVVLPDGVRPAELAVRDGVIVAIGDPEALASTDITDFGDSVVMAGIVDTHVHINEPGRTEWEGFETATMAAAAGGVTTLIEMPLNSIPATTSLSALREKFSAAAGKLFVDAGFWGGVVPGNSFELAGMYDHGAFGFKCFLVPSGVPEFAAVSEADLEEAMPELARLGAVLLAHAELPGPIADATLRVKEHNPRTYRTWLESHPSGAEHQAIELLIRLSKRYRTRVHIVHLSSAGAAPMIRAARDGEGVKITVETCPHYLMIAAEDIPDGATQFKCAPPVRERGNQEQLWAALREGTIDFVATDHSPAPPSMKCYESGDFMRAWGGIASLQLSLPLVWTGAHKRGFGICDVAHWLCSGPARLAGLSRKGVIAIGHDADLVIWKPEEMFQAQPDKMFFRHGLTPYSGRTLFGVVQSTFLGGEEIYVCGDFPRRRRGRVLQRGEA